MLRTRDGGTLQRCQRITIIMHRRRPIDPSLLSALAFSTIALVCINVLARHQARHWAAFDSHWAAFGCLAALRGASVAAMPPSRRRLHIANASFEIVTSRGLAPKQSENLKPYFRI